jgi:hypothetical protein
MTEHVNVLISERHGMVDEKVIFNPWSWDEMDETDMIKIF